MVKSGQEYSDRLTANCPDLLLVSHLAPSTKLLVLSGEWVKVKGQRLTLAILYPFPLPLDPTH